MRGLQHIAVNLFFRSHAAGVMASDSDRNLPSLLKVSRLTLIVLAPHKYYERYASHSKSLPWLAALEQKINGDFDSSSVCQAMGLSLMFRFECFPDWFHWHNSPTGPRLCREEVLSALFGRLPYFAP
jgi:hypothetical protein